VSGLFQSEHDTALHPEVSVIIPVRNGERTLARAIDSALGQRFERGFEVIVINDGSTDGSADILRGYGDRIVAIRPQHQGLSAARNAGARIARGEYLAFLDADDEWMPEKLARVVSALGERPECVLAYHDAREIGLDGRVQRSSYYYKGYSPPSFEELRTPRGHENPILPSTVVIRREAFERIGGFNEQLTASEDIYMLIRARECGPFAFVPEVLADREFGPSAGRETWYIDGARALDRALAARYGSQAAGGFLFAALLWCAGAAYRRGDYKSAITRCLSAICRNPIRAIPYIAVRLAARAATTREVAQA